MVTPSLTSQDICARKGGQKIVMLTVYDATFASIFDGAGVDIMLVGDSLGMVIQGHNTTLPVTLDDMVYHTRAVVRGASRAQVVADLPFMTYQTGSNQALQAAGKLIQVGGAHGVKLEGGRAIAPQIETIVTAGIPVMGHIGLTPQSVHQMGGFKVQGKDPKSAQRILDDARALQDAGCYCLVLEGIPTELAHSITAAIDIPTIGIGAGMGCDGQVLVCYDLLGMNPSFTPKFVKHYDNLFERITNATKKFAAEVKDGTFPDAGHSFSGGTLQLAQQHDAKNNPNEPEPSSPTLYSVPKP